MTKCIRFGKNVHFVKDNLLPVPPVFREIQKVSRTDDAEMHRVYNMGQRLEIYVEDRDVASVQDIASSLGLESRVIGHTEESRQPDGKNHITLTTASGATIAY